MSKLTPENLLLIRRYMQLKALAELKRGQMRSARMLITQQALGPTLSISQLTRELLQDASGAKYHDEDPSESEQSWLAGRQE